MKPNEPIKTPVAFLVFNRPETTRRVFEVIRAVRPALLLVVADGPRVDRPDDVALCTEVRRICQQVDWPCDLRLHLREGNLGCRLAVTDGINWIFEQVERAIILEDDCLPDVSFFQFCEELLEHYSDDEEVGMISGNNFQFGKNQTPDSYFFALMPHIWGWATWRRAWDKMDLEMQSWPAVKKTDWLERTFRKGPQTHFWSTWFDDAFLGEKGALKTWDAAWAYACQRNGLKCIIPELNLVKNIGFGENSTHTENGEKWEKLDAGEIVFPLRHPSSKNCFTLADDYTQRHHYYGATLAQLIFYTLRFPIPLRTVAAFWKWIQSLGFGSH